MKIYKKFLTASLLATTLSAGSLFNNNHFDNDMKIIQDMFNKMLNSHFYNDLAPIRNSAIKVNVYEKDNTYFIEYELAGVDKKDIKLSLEEDKFLKLEITKEVKKEEENKNYVKKEFSYGSVQRVIMLPDDAKTEKLKTSHKNGILTVSIPKTKAKTPKSRVINID